MTRRRVRGADHVQDEGARKEKQRFNGMWLGLVARSNEVFVGTEAGVDRA